ncbi:MAG: hypothetical protein ABIH00_03290 [Armatimonadota bacterium]
MTKDIKKEELRNLYNNYRRQIERQLGTAVEKTEKISSSEYSEFKKAYMPKHLSIYEKACSLCERTVRIKPNKKREAEIQEAIDICHLNVTPVGVSSLSILGPVIIALLGSLIFFALTQSTFFILLFLLLGIGMMKPLERFPEYTANNWRMKASNQMVLCVFYVVTYMRHTSNLEKALQFASNHLAPPLSLDMKKILWDIETEKYESVKESLDIYLETWKKWNMEFIEAFHLIEASLFEGDEDRRLTSLDRSLDLILDETYERMLHYAHNLQSPITMLHMLGIILPILGLVILPLVVSFMEEVKWYHISALYNFVLPVVVYFMGKSILSRRPTGYGDTDISEENPELSKYKNIIFKIGKTEIKMSPLYFSICIIVLFVFIGFSPIILHLIGFPDIPFGGEDPGSVCKGKFCLLGYRTSDTGEIKGPYGLGATIISLAVTIGLGIGIGFYYKVKSKNVMKIRDRAKKLETEFAAALFQLGNRLGDGIPAETAFAKVSNAMEGTISGNFFLMVSNNIRRLGMGVKQAIFDVKRGALVFFPSNLIESSMQVLVQSIKKGPMIAAQALTNVARYIKEIHKVNERLKDLMADVISSMKSQIKFLTPAIAGIVIGITSMVTTILGKLTEQLSTVSAGGGADGAAAGGGIMDIFGLGVPAFHFQIIVGIYVVQITYILTILANGIENGSDKLNERYEIGNNLVRSTLLYVIISGIVILAFNLVAGSILSSTGYS